MSTTDAAAAHRARPGWALAAVHVPKTAGTSFMEVLSSIYGDGLLLDNADRPLSRPAWQRRGRAAAHAVSHAGQRSPAACIYGHFMPLKYALLRRLRFSVWLRDPVQRVVSRYHHYQRHGQAETQHRRWGLVPGLSLDAFVRIAQYQNTYAEYFWMFPMRRFDFVGIVEHYDDEVARFLQRFELAAQAPGGRRNANPDRQGDRYAIDPSTERLIRTLNARDVAIYERARDASGVAAARP